MKFNSTILLSVFSFTLFNSTLFGQITINRADYLMQFNQTDTALEMSSVNFPVPASGLNQFWDYSSYSNFPFAVQFDYDSTNNTTFPTANQDVLGDFVFQGGYLITATDYLELKSSSYVHLGTTTQYAAYSVANRTGGASDTLYFPQDNKTFNSPDTLLKFPMNYLDSNTCRPLDTVNFQLSVAGFGLNKTPGQVIYDLTIRNKIIGSGRMVIPQPFGLISDTMDVLLTRRIQTRRDSIFLGGAPAPGPLLSAFGLVQGQVVLDTTYKFYRKGYRNAVAEVDYLNKDVLFYHNADVNVTTGINKVQVYKNLKGYPNPVNKGAVFKFEAFDNLQRGLISLIDITGKTVLNQPVSGVFDLQLKIPEAIKNGIYFIELVNLESNEKFINRIIVR